MRRFIAFFCFCCLTFFRADSATISLDELEGFYGTFMCQEKNILSEAGLTSKCASGVTPLPTPPPPTPPPNPPAPPVVAGLLPIVIVNNSGLPDTEVFVLLQGRVPIGGPQLFMDFAPVTGVGTPHLVVLGDNGSTYSQPLSYFPASPGGGHVFYIPMTDSFLVFISLKNKLNIPVVTGGIADPAFDNPNDPYGNFNTVWDQFEGAFVTTTPNIAVDATAVSFFSIPLYVYLSTPDPGSNSNCGLSQTRSSLMSYMKSVFSVVPPPPENAQWSKLVLNSGSSPLRILSPGKAIAGGFFDQNYLDNVSSYFYSYLSDIWYGATAFYRTHTLSIKIPNGSVYSGTSSGNTIVLHSGSNQVVLGPVAIGPPYSSSTSYNILSGLHIYSSATIDADGIQVSKALEEAIIAGIAPTTSLIDASTNFTLSAFKPYYQTNPNLTGLGKSTGPWYDLYSAGLHACGLIYTFAFDEPLWPEVLLQSSTLLPTTYIGVTIGNTQ